MAISSVKYVDFRLGSKDAIPPRKKYSGDAGWDLAVSRPQVVKPGETVDVHTDIYIGMPPNIYARITGRSSTMRKHNLLVNEGIIDNGYTGEMFISIYNMGAEPFRVEKGMRLAQLIFSPILDIRMAEVDKIEETPGQRNDKGFGSTGEGEWQ